MLDSKFIRENSELVKEGLLSKGDSFDLNSFLKLDEERRRFLKQAEELRAVQNKLNNEVSALIKRKENPKDKITQSKENSRKLAKVEKEFKSVKENFQKQLYNIPNIPHSSVPRGDISHNKIIKSQDKLKNSLPGFPVYRIY